MELPGRSGPNICSTLAFQFCLEFEEGFPVIWMRCLQKELFVKVCRLVYFLPLNAKPWKYSKTANQEKPNREAVQIFKKFLRTPKKTKKKKEFNIKVASEAMNWNFFFRKILCCMEDQLSELIVSYKRQNFICSTLMRFYRYPSPGTEGMCNEQAWSSLSATSIESSRFCNRNIV